MRDIPTFTTQNGVASLTLSEIPYKQAAYVRIHDASEPEQFLEECCDFCRAVGAQHIYATGHSTLVRFAVSAAINRMTRSLAGLPKTDATLLPVQDESCALWCEMYNHKMAKIPHSAYMTQAKAKEHLKKGDAYFVYRGDTLLGLGVAYGEMVAALASVVSGAGQDVLLALTSVLSSDRVCVEVASSNTRAIALYRKLGFRMTEEGDIWHRIL